MKIQIFSRRPLLIGPLTWYFRIRAANGEIIASSEGYRRRIDCIGTAHSLRNDLANAEIIDV